MSNRLQKDLANAKARLKAALNKLEKLESSDDNQAIAAAQSKVDLEREIIEDIEKRLQNETKNFTAIVRQEDGSLDEIAEDNAPPISKKRKRDLPQVSFRTDEEYYERLKIHYQNPVSSHLSTFDNLADMTRKLNLADLKGDIYFGIERTNQQLARFLEAIKSDKSLLPSSEKLMLRNTFIKFQADSDAEKAKLVEKIESLHQFIKSLELYRRSN
ncbi:hypothetical protein [Myxosarcina sp. GI1(2024)]